MGTPLDSTLLEFATRMAIETWYLHTQVGSECSTAGLCGRDQSVFVEAGQVIAIAGNTGLGSPCSDSNCPGAHLHFEVRRTGNPNDLVDPYGCDDQVAMLQESRCGKGLPFVGLPALSGRF